MSSIVKKAYKDIYNKECPYNTSIKYSRKFKGYNANVRYNEKEIDFRLSYNWKNVSEEIKIGLLQSLLNKVFKTKKNTINIDMYNIFLKKVHITVPKTKSDPLLEDSFIRVNKKYFNDMILMPNLTWCNSLNKLGSYDYGTDTITISKILFDNILFLDYVMYHEILHKKLKFKNKNSRNYHHTKEFKQKEKQFEDIDVEDKLKKFLKKKRLKKMIKFW
jgi:hypothetical protein